jgi:dihydrofolate reductase
MGVLRYSVSMSADGFVAGPGQSTEHPLGVGGLLLHAWMRELAIWREQAGLAGGVVNASTKVIEREDENIGAVIMGRNMFGGGPGPWAEPLWNGWWGDNPPFHLPVFVLTRHARPPLECEGGTRFEFVTGGIAAALERARGVAGGRDVAISGGAGVAKQYLAAGLVDELLIHLVPVFLGGGVRLFDDPALTAITMEQEGAVEAPGVTHLTYRISRCAS